MAREPVEVEVLDREALPAKPAKRTHNLNKPMTALIFTFAMFGAFLVLLFAIVVALQERARNLVHKPDQGPE